MLRQGNISWKKNNRWRDIRCWLGWHNGWRYDIYVDTARPFKYCPNCNMQVKPDSPTPFDIPPPTNTGDMK